MFKAKYIFETRKTRMLRYFKGFSVLVFGVFFLYLISGYFFILVGHKENQKTSEAFYQSRPDLIVVFTGAPGRIPHAIQQAKRFKQGHIFITGVYAKNSVDTLIMPAQINDELDPNLLEIDYLARNTVENAIFTVRHLQKSPGFKRVMIVSHDYHILRIKTIINHITKDSPNQYEFYYEGVVSDYSKMKTLKILYKEIYKWARTLGFLALWDVNFESV